MEIVYLGHSSFRIKGKVATVVTDPYGDKIGKFPKDVSADLVTISHDHFDHNATGKISGSPFIASGPGEYEARNVSVVGISTFHDNEGGKLRGSNTIFVVELDGLRLCHLGDLGHKLTSDQTAEIGPIDILFVPVGGYYTLDAKTAADIVKQLDPWVAIPMHYANGNLENLAPVDDFLKEMGNPGLVPLPKYTLVAEKLPTEQTVVVLGSKI